MSPRIKRTATIFLKDFMKKLRFYILAIITVFTLFCFASINKVYADSPQDITFTLNASDYSGRTICDSSDSSLPDCSGYSYLIVNFSDVDNSTAYFTLYTNVAQTVSFRVYDYGVTSVSYSLPSNLSYLRYGSGIIHNYFSTFPNGTITVTVSASNNCPACPSCPECEDCDEPFIVRLFQQGFWGIATAIVSLIVPIVALFLVFRLVHDFFWGRG